MTKLVDKIAEIRARVVTLGDPVDISKPTDLRKLFRCTGVKLIDGVNREFFADLAVHNHGEADEIAVEKDTNKEPIEDTVLAQIKTWFEGENIAGIVTYKVIDIMTGPLVSVPSAKLQVWVLEADTIVEKQVFIWKDGATPQWKYMAP